MFLNVQHLGVRGACWSSEMGIKTSDKPHAYMDLQNSSWLVFGGSHHLPPYSIMYD
jgi:hypothetical protein